LRERATRLAVEGRRGPRVGRWGIRQAALADFAALYGSAQWRTHLALHATFLSLADGELRDRAQDVLRRSERGFVDRVAASWQRIAELFGYRVRPESGASFETIATPVSATAPGLILMALSTPDIARARAAAQPFGVAERAEWSIPALGMAAIASSLLESDPTIRWDAGRVIAVHEALASLDLPTA
jgi:hypothetical protein